MRRSLLAAGTLLLTLVACEPTTAPGGPPSGDLDGRWGWQLNGNPGGSYITLTLATAGSSVNGTGGVCGIGGNCTPGPVTVSGTHTPTFGPFTLTLRGAGGWVATYAGSFVGAEQLQGTWTQGSQSHTVTLVRCTPTSFC